MAYIQRTQGGSGNQKTFTISLWIKRANVTDEQCFLSVADGSDYLQFKFNSDEYLEYNDGPSTIRFITSRKFRDPGAWYHIVIKFDSTQAIEGDRFKMFINGVQETAFGTATYPGLNTDSRININTGVIALGVDQSDGSVFEGVMSWVQLVDGTALDATEFGEVDSTSGIWKIKTDVYGTPGVNGFCLKMEDRTNLDLDSSSNAHTFTTSGNVTATYDNPSNNFATFNPLVKGDNAYTNGNLTATTDSSNWHSAVSSLCVGAGKWYVEYKWNATGGTNFGIADARSISLFGEGEMGYLPTGALGDSVGWYGGGSDVKKNGTAYYSADTYSAGDIISVALDCDNGAVYFRKNGGTWQNSGVPTSGATRTGAVPITTGETYFFGGTTYSNGCNISGNFGNGYFGTTAVASTNADDAGIGSFEYDVPTGFYALCTKNIKAYGG